MKKQVRFNLPAHESRRVIKHIPFKVANQNQSDESSQYEQREYLKELIINQS